MYKLDDRFWSKVYKTSSCWIWLGAKSSTGYGRYKIGRKLFSPHRLVVNCPDNLCACHKCDNPSCVNPEHIFIGTYSENMLDCSRKGRLPIHLKERKHPSQSAYRRGCRCNECKAIVSEQKRLHWIDKKCSIDKSANVCYNK